MPAQFVQSLEPRHLLAAGVLDETFGVGGAVAVRVEHGLSVGSIDQLPDGKLLVAFDNYAGQSGFMRLHADGSLDTTFGDAGRSTIGMQSFGSEVAVDAAGRIARAGGAGEIVVLNSDGTRDTSVGVNGVINANKLAGLAGDSQIAFAPDGKLVVVAPIGSGNNIAVMRLSSSGALDPTFRDGGILFLAEVVDDVAVAGDGTILIATHYFTTVSDSGIEEPLSHVRIHRLSPDGQSDDVLLIGGGLDNTGARVKDLEAAPDGSVSALVYDLDESRQQYVYTVRRYAALGAAEIQQFPLSLPMAATALEVDVSDAGHTIVSGYDHQNLWFTQRYTSSGRLDLSYGSLGTAWPNIAGPAADWTGDAAVLGNGSVVIANTRTRGGEIHDVVLAKIAGSEGLPADFTLNARGTLIMYGTPADDQISLYLRGRDGRLIARADDFVQSYPPSRVKRIAIFAGEGNDLVTIGTGVRGTYVQGDEGNDTILGGDNADILLGGAGDDELHGGLASDRMFGDDGNDTLYGNGGKDLMFGGAGDDDLWGNGHDDTLDGGDGNDRLFGGGGVDLIFGGNGFDTAAVDELDLLLDDIESLIS